MVYKMSILYEAFLFESHALLNQGEFLGLFFVKKKYPHTLLVKGW